MEHLGKFTTCLSRIRQIPEDLYCMYMYVWRFLGSPKRKPLENHGKKALGFDENDTCLLLPKSYRFMNHDNLVP